MIPRRKFELERHATFEQSEQNVIDDIYFSAINIKGKVYNISCELGGFEFVLTLPDGSTIKDSFLGISERKALYENLEKDEMLTWLKEVEHSINFRRKTEGRSYKKLPIGYTAYQVSVDRQSGMGWLHIPAHTLTFETEDLYMFIPELPIVADGMLNNELRDHLVGVGLTLPDTPYEPGVIILPKD